jgi:uracil phosphoribosyltransferase
MLVDHTDNPMMRLIVNATRQASLSGPALAEAHRNIGRALASALTLDLILEDIAIDHVAGGSIGVQIQAGSEPIIIAMMRAGLFVAEGIWAAVPGSSLVLHNAESELKTLPALGRTVVVVDSVINTGRSIRGVLKSVNTYQPSKIKVAALVAYRANLEILINEFPSVDFHVARISDRSYVGKGSTDTGSRLFCTTTWGCEA